MSFSALGLFTLWVPKETVGEHFEGLQLLTSLLAPKGSRSAKPMVEDVTGRKNLNAKLNLLIYCKSIIWSTQIGQLTSSCAARFILANHEFLILQKDAVTTREMMKTKMRKILTGRLSRRCTGRALKKS